MDGSKVFATLRITHTQQMIAIGVLAYLWAEFYDAANTYNNITPVSNMPCTPL